MTKAKKLSSADVEKYVILFNAKRPDVTMTENTLKLIHAFTYVMRAKMDGAMSISTSVLENAICQARRKLENSICADCYADNQLHAQPSTRKKMENNDNLLKLGLIPYDEIPVLPVSIPEIDWNVEALRFEAFGDLENVIQGINYINIAAKNSHIDSALWTKNPRILKMTFEYVEKPSNLKIGYSSIFKDIVIRIEAIQRLYPFIDFTFNVVTLDGAKKNGHVPTCMRSCRACGFKCYKGTHESNTVIEMLHADSKQAVKQGLYQ